MKEFMPTPGSNVELSRGDRETKSKRERGSVNTGINKIKKGRYKELSPTLLTKTRVR